MDPNSVSFTPQNDVWRLSDTMRTFQQTQQEHAERLMRLEKRQEEDTRIKSVWGPSSPFPGALSGASSQQGPFLRSTSHDDFTNFDDDDGPNSMVRSLQLDADDEPRPPASTSRANSVRFDASAKPGQWAPGSRASMDYLSRTSSSLGGLGGHPLFERTTSHKSDGRQSSAGHSASRANSLGLETGQAFGQSPIDPPALAPGLFILGSVPAIIRCWLNTNFKHDSLRYAAVCSGSHKSYLDIKLIEELGFLGHIRQDISGSSKLKLQLYMPEAVLHHSSSRSSSPAPQLPCMSIDFTVADHNSKESNPKAIQVFIGSDTLRAHNADILFSSNSMTVFDDERNKLSIPFVRPENDETFKSLYITSASLPTQRFPINVAPGSRTPLESNKSDLNGIGIARTDTFSQRESLEEAVEQLQHQPQPTLSPMPNEQDQQTASKSRGTESIQALERQDSDQKPILSTINTSKTESREPHEDSPIVTASSRTGSSPAIWSNWRRDSGGAGDWAGASRGSSSNYQRPNRDQGIKVLKPTSRQASRNPPAPPSSSQSPGPTASPRFFDDAKRRGPTGPSSNASDGGDMSHSQILKRSGSSDPSKTTAKESSAGKSGVKTMNPIGGASAFGWLNPDQK